MGRERLRRPRLVVQRLTSDLPHPLRHTSWAASRHNQVPLPVNIAAVATPRGLDQVLRPGGTDVPADMVEQWDLPYDLGATDAERADIRAKINANQPVPPTHGNPLYPYGAGLQGWR